jgi:hypothetical protein
MQRLLSDWVKRDADSNARRLRRLVRKLHSEHGEPLYRDDEHQRDSWRDIQLMVWMAFIAWQHDAPRALDHRRSARVMPVPLVLFA